MHKMYKARTEIIQYFDDLSNGFTPRLHLMKVNYPMVRALCAMQGAFLIEIWKKRYKWQKIILMEWNNILEILKKWNRIVLRR